MKKATSNFMKEFKLWKACSKKEEFRPVMEHVLFKDGYAYASDSHVLVRVPLEECTTFDEDQRALLDGYLIHRSMLQYIVGFDTVLVKKTDDGDVYLEANAGGNIIKVQLAKDGGDLKYPNAEAILQRKSERTPVQKIGFAPKFIASLTDALGTSRLEFAFADEKSAVFVRPVSEISEAIGVIMPIMTD